MLPKLAAIVVLAFVVYLFWSDSKKPNQPSAALWIPLLWMFLAGSRWASSWLNLSVPRESADDYAEGSPVDRAVFFALIAVAAYVLSQRKIDWRRLLVQNKWIVFYFLYCLLSIFWTDEPFVLFKRWVKDLGNPIMVLVILTEDRPYFAVGVILRRLAFLLLPLSVLFIRYYPELGRGYRIDGSPMFTGVGHQKNDLGLMCLISGIYFFWDFFQNRKRYFKAGIKDIAINLIFIGMLSWLLYMSNSQTSLGCLVVAVFLLGLSQARYIARRPSRIINVMVTVVLLAAILEATLGIKENVFEVLGRDPTLTNRTDVWKTLKEMGTDPMVGAGFMSFWTGDRLLLIWQKIGTGINQAHSGYLEQYLNLGYIGVAFIGVISLSSLAKVRKHLDLDPQSALLRLCFIVTAALYNYTEASFYGINNMWLLLLLGCIEIPLRRARKEPSVNLSEAVPS